MPELPRIRVRDDGTVALHYPKAGAPGDWMVIPAEAVLVHWEIDKAVAGPGWHAAVILSTKANQQRDDEIGRLRAELAQSRTYRITEGVSDG